MRLRAGLMALLPLVVVLGAPAQADVREDAFEPCVSTLYDRTLSSRFEPDTQRNDSSIDHAGVAGDVLWTVTRGHYGSTYGVPFEVLPQASAYARADGALLWQRTLAAPRGPNETVQAAAASAGTLYLAGNLQGNGIVALDLATGAPTWTASLPQLPFGLALSPEGDRLLARRHDAAYVIDASTGALLTTIAMPRGLNGATFLPGDRVALATRTADALDSSIETRDALTGALIWSADRTEGRDAGLARLAAAPSGELVAIQHLDDREQRVHGYDAATGAPLWSFTSATGDLLWADVEVRWLANGRGIVMTSTVDWAPDPDEQQLHLAAFDPATGLVSWTRNFSHLLPSTYPSRDVSPARAPLSADGSRLYVGLETTVRAIETADGTLAWENRRIDTTIPSLWPSQPGGIDILTLAPDGENLLGLQRRNGTGVHVLTLGTKDATPPCITVERGPGRGAVTVHWRPREPTDLAWPHQIEAAALGATWPPPPLAPAGEAAPGANHFVVGGFGDNQTIRVAVRADGSARSEIAYIRTATTPGAPRHVTAHTTPHGTQVTWWPPTDDGGDAVALYEVWRGRTGEPVQLAYRGSARSFVDPPVAALAGSEGVRGIYQVRAVNAVGHGPPATGCATHFYESAPELHDTLCR